MQAHQSRAQQFAACRRCCPAAPFQTWAARGWRPPPLSHSEAPAQMREGTFEDHTVHTDAKRGSASAAAAADGWPHLRQRNGQRRR